MEITEEMLAAASRQEADAIALNTEAEVLLYQADVTGNHSVMAHGFVSRRVAQLIEEGQHVPAGSTAETQPALKIPGYEI